MKNRANQDAADAAQEAVVDEAPVTFVTGSGNVFADAGLADADELLFRGQLALMIADIIRARGYTQRQAAAVTGLAQPDVSAIVKGKLVGISVERLLRALKALGKGIELHIKDDDGEMVVAV